MRKALLACVLSVWMLTNTALAEVYEGTTVAASSTEVEAAASGILREMNVFAGSIVSEGDVLGDISTTKVFASQDGTVARIHVSEGDSSEGTVMEIAPVEQYLIYCTADEAYESAESMLVHSGERVFIKCTSDGTHRGAGLITEIDDAEYRVLATGGEFYVGETVYLYRDSEFTSKQRVGIGTVVGSDVESYDAEGTMIRLHVAEGEYVERGELLFEYADSEETQMKAETDGVITEIFVQQGARVEKGEKLMSLAAYDEICVEIKVDEAAAGRINKGDAAQLIYADDLTETPVMGTVESVAHIAEAEMYAVRIRPDDASGIRLGMTVTVRIGSDIDFSNSDR